MIKQTNKIESLIKYGNLAGANSKYTFEKETTALLDFEGRHLRQLGLGCK